MKQGKSIGVIAAGLLLVVAASVPLSAQVTLSSPVRFGITGGGTVPVNQDFKDLSKTGWHAGALIDVGLPFVPLGFRVDGMWHQLGEKDLASGLTSKNRIIDGTVNALYSFGAMSPTKLYLIGGVGVYNLKSEVEGEVAVLNDRRLASSDGFGPRVDSGVNEARGSSTSYQVGTSNGDSDSRTKFGVNAGVGLRFQLPGFTTFVEARWHSIFTDGENVQMLPISVGITF
jgi:opacity protein-like surface antigen